VDLGFAPDDLGFIASPYPVYAALRAEAPIVHDEATDLWLVSRYEDVSSMLRDRRFGRTYRHVQSHEAMGREAPPVSHEPFWHLIDHGILDMEPPDHTRVRRLIAKAFTLRTVENLRAPIQALTDGLVRDLRGSGTFDLIASVAEPLPVAVIGELLGIPDTDRHLLRPWSAEICRMYELHPTEEDAAAAVRASIEFSDYLRMLSSSGGRHRPRT
jgi:cytochrome P450